MAKSKKKSSLPFLLIVIILLIIIAVSLFNIVRLIGKYQVGTTVYNKVAEQVDAGERGINWDKGSIFMAAANDPKFKDFNTIIYGHRMKDGSMFHSLADYLEDGFYEKHKVMQIFTPKRDYDLHVFAAMEVPVDSPLYKIDFQDDEEKQDYLNKIDAESVLDTDVEPTTEDHIVMLSTCAYDYENARDLVFGVLREK